MSSVLVTKTKGTLILDLAGAADQSTLSKFQIAFVDSVTG